jgi:hypothetical protein
MGANAKAYLSAYHDEKGKRGNITNEDKQGTKGGGYRVRLP